MELPEDIKKRILEYLQMEYVEDPSDPHSLTLEQISYDGEYEIHGVLTHYFKYESSSGRNWATVEPFGDSYVLGMNSNSPVPIKKDKIYSSIHVESMDDGEVQKLGLESWGEGCYGFSDYKQILFKSGKKFKLLAEVTSFSQPYGVVVAIKDGENDIYIRGSVGLALSYESKTLGSISITLGTGPWE